MLPLPDAADHERALRAVVARWHQGGAPVTLRADPARRGRAVIAAHVEGCGTIGHLAPGDARAYAPVFRALAARGQVGVCRATIVGPPPYRVWLAVAPPDCALE